MRNYAAYSVLLSLAFGVCHADSIRITGILHEDVYVTEFQGRYYVYSQDGRQIADVSAKRMDVKDAIIDREDPGRKALVARLRTSLSKGDGKRSLQAAKPIDSHILEHNIASSVDKTNRLREKYDALMKKEKETSQSRSFLLEKAAVEAEKREKEQPLLDQARAEQDKARWARESKWLPRYQAPAPQASAGQTPAYGTSANSAGGKVNNSLVDTMKQQWQNEGFAGKSREEQREAMALMVLIADSDCPTVADREATLDYIQHQIDGWGGR